MGADPREVGEVFDGTTLRDAAVDPRPTDFLPPTNAGLEGEAGNPHGPNVVSPEIHAVEGNRPVLAGLVSSDPAVQEAAETAHLAEWHQTAGAITAWAASTAYVVGDRVSTASGAILTASVAGTSGTVEPTGPGVDGTVTWA